MSSRHLQDAHTFLLARGWELARDNGPHPIYKFPKNGRQTTVSTTCRDRGRRWDNLVADAKRMEAMPPPGSQPKPTPTENDMSLVETVTLPEHLLAQIKRHKWHTWMSTVRSRSRLGREEIRQAIANAQVQADLDLPDITIKQIKAWETASCAPTEAQFRAWLYVFGLDFSQIPEGYIPFAVEAPKPPEPMKPPEPVKAPAPQRIVVRPVQRPEVLPTVLPTVPANYEIPTMADVERSPSMREVRLAKGLSSREVSEYLNIARQTYLSVEAGSTHLDAAEFIPWALLLEVPEDYAAVVITERRAVGRRAARRCSAVIVNLLTCRMLAGGAVAFDSLNTVKLQGGGPGAAKPRAATLLRAQDIETVKTVEDAPIEEPEVPIPAPSIAVKEPTTAREVHINKIAKLLKNRRFTDSEVETIVTGLEKRLIEILLSDPDNQ